MILTKIRQLAEQHAASRSRAPVAPAPGKAKSFTPLAPRTGLSAPPGSGSTGPQLLASKLSNHIGGTWNLMNIGDCHKAILELVENNEALLECVRQLDELRMPGAVSAPRGEASRPRQQQLSQQNQPNQTELDRVRARLENETDPLQRAELARKCRQLRGHEGLFDEPKLTPGGEAMTFTAPACQ